MAKAPQATTFGSILDKRVEDIKEPVTMPTGSYVFTIHGLPRYDKSSKKQTEFVEFTCNYVEALDDVDQDQLAAAGGFAGKQTKLTFYLTEEAAYRLKDFLAHLKIEEQETLRPMIEEATGRSFIGTIRHEPSQDGTRMFARIGSTAPIEE